MGAHVMGTRITSKSRTQLLVGPTYLSSDAFYHPVPAVLAQVADAAVAESAAPLLVALSAVAELRSALGSAAFLAPPSVLRVPSDERSAEAGLAPPVDKPLAAAPGGHCAPA